MKVSDIMTSPVYTIRDRDTVGDAARLMADEGVSALPVLDDIGGIVGILSHTDFFLHPVRYPGGWGPCLRHPWTLRQLGNDRRGFPVDQ